MSEIETGEPVTTTTGSEGEESVEARGATITEAVTRALDQLGISRDEAEIEVLNEGARAIPGERLTGSEARVRVRRMDAYSSRARSLLEELLTRMEIPARVTVRRAGPSKGVEPGHEPVILDISGDDLGLLIGWRGENLRALQTVLNLMMGDNEAEGRRLILDVERYRARREERVRELAVRVAHRVKRTGERMVLEPMHAYERRVVHITLEGDEGVRTESTGAEPARRVTIHPTGPARGGPPHPDETRGTFHGIPRGPRPGGGGGGFRRPGGPGGGRPGGGRPDYGRGPRYS
ncbi:MAG TPA: RNA-binding cell elongation regulator Jag/EloR [Candidatus Dormibacteraeota bacterium]|nr:RNA-binding cell elongation regulator Jag/EloR [Candidatus Dormibacteraeota bacterium]